MNNESIQTLMYVIYYLIGLILGFIILSILGLFAAASILKLIAYIDKINI